MQQRVREAAKAELAGRAVQFELQEGGAGHQLVAMYRVSDYARTSRHVIFTGGSGRAFARECEACRELFAGLVAQGENLGELRDGVSLWPDVGGDGRRDGGDVSEMRPDRGNLDCGGCMRVQGELSGLSVAAESPRRHRGHGERAEKQ
jgi:hypothetical protein